MLDSYLSREIKVAFPQMELYDLKLMFFRTLSSSSQALQKLLEGVYQRLSKMETDETVKILIDEEIELFKEMIEACK